MSREAIKVLLGRVEAGDCNQNTFLKYGHELPMLASMWEAYDGSLDAAVSLLGAVLPGWGIMHMGLTSKGKGYASLSGPRIEDVEQGRSDKGMARALLIAILRSLIAEGDG